MNVVLGSPVTPADESCVRTGDAFSGSGGASPSNLDLWTYNDRNELTGSERYHSTNPGSPTDPQSDLDREYVCDQIGNRKRYKEGDDPNLFYCTNNLNQYTATDDAEGCASPIESFAYDTDGNLTGDGGKVPGAARPDGTPRKFTWDGENRLIRVEPADGYSPVSGDVKVEFRYDYLGRRVEKKVSTHDGSSWAVTDTRRFLWYNWLMLLELQGSTGVPPVFTVLKKYTWGLDLAGLSGQVNSLESAGGIGGLLACYDTAGTSGTGADKSYAYMFDGNGNVGQLVDVSDGSIDAHYEYDAYGNAAVAIGAYAASNTMRFSTKYWDDETGLGYWGLRIRDSERWLSRDPLYETGAFLLYEYANNDPINYMDSIGAQPCDSCCCAEDLYVTNIQETGNKHSQVTDWGHSFDVVGVVRFQPWSKKGIGLCTFEWWEYYRVLNDGENVVPSIPYDPNQWTYLVPLATSATKFQAAIKEGLKPPLPEDCYPTRKFVTHDDPAIRAGNRKGLTTHRQLWINVVLRSAPGCRCNFSARAVGIFQELSLQQGIGEIRRLGIFPGVPPGRPPWVEPPSWPPRK